MAANVESMEELQSSLALHGVDFPTFPFVMQYNKRDLPKTTPIEELEALLNPTGRPRFESVAFKGLKVLATLQEAWSQVQARHAVELAGGASDVRTWEPSQLLRSGGPSPTSWFRRLLGPRRH